MISILKGSKLFAEVAVAGIHNIRGAEPEMLLRHFDGMKCSFAADVEQALNSLLTKKKEKDFIYIAGSLYFVGEVKALVRRKSND